MKKIQGKLSRYEKIGKVDPRLSGQFIEVHRDCIYGGIYQPGHPLSDEQGFRKDLIEEIRSLKVPMIRIPGGNYCSNYHWKDGIGPKENRPVKIEMAWNGIDTNELGTHEYLDWAKKCGMEAALTTNLGTGTAEEAAQWVEYCNVKSGTYYSDLRIKNGQKEPFGVHTWYVGNEMDGAWQIGFLSPEDYGRKARHACDMMKFTDPSIELIVCGTSTDRSPQRMEWDRIVLEECYSKADLLSIHEYYAWPGAGNRDLYLASYARIDRFIRKIVAACDYVQAHQQSKKQMMIAFDEWAVQCETRERPEEFRYHPGMVDVLAAGGMICTLLNHADRVKIGGQTMLVNALSILFTRENGTLRSGYYPLIREMIDCSGGTVLKSSSDAPLLRTDEVDAPSVCQSAVWLEDRKELKVIVLNLSPEQVAYQLGAEGFASLTLKSHQEIRVTDGDEDLPNTVENPDRLMPKAVGDAEDFRKEGTVCLQPSSWNVLTFRAE